MKGYNHRIKINFDDFDAKYDTSIAMSSSDNFYTMLGTKKNAIQGRSPLDIKSDRVSLGMSNFITGKYTIKLENKDGVFANGQNVYVKDNQTGIIQELKDSEGYSFETNAGVIEGRFEIIYQNESTLVTQDVVKDNGVMVYRDNNALVIKSNSIINQVELFDVAGVLIYKKDNPDARGEQQNAYYEVGKQYMKPILRFLYSLEFPS